MTRGLQRSRLTRVALAVPIVVGLLVGGFALASAANTPTSPDRSTAGASTDFGTHLGSVGQDPSVPVSNDEVQITTWIDDEGQVCASVVWKAEQTTDEICSPTSDVASGLVYGLHVPRPGSDRLIYGLVPDGVIDVEVDGLHISPSGNVWYVISPRDVSELAVRSESATATLSLDPRDAVETFVEQ